MTKHDSHPAIHANRLSIQYAMAGDRQAWLDLYAEDAVLADPVGASPFDPSGEGHRGRDAIGRFWDLVIGPAKLTITPGERITSGERCCAVPMTAINDLGHGLQTRVDMIAVYEVDDAGKIASMKAYWSWGALQAQLTALGLG